MSKIEKNPEIKAGDVLIGVEIDTPEYYALKKAVKENNLAVLSVCKAVRERKGNVMAEIMEHLPFEPVGLRVGTYNWIGAVMPEMLEWIDDDNSGGFFIICNNAHQQHLRDYIGTDIFQFGIIEKAR